MAFLDDNYLLTTDTGKKLYEQVRDLPIVDAHNHADVKSIWENRNFSDIWEVEAAGDHYVWEILRKRGVPENLITGNASNEEKWMALAEVFPECAGNPTYDWIHLDLKRQFGIDQLINKDTGKMIWDKTQEMLQDPAMRPRHLLKQMKVENMCSTDDPIDSLEYHIKLNASDLSGIVRPTFRPDKAMKIDAPDWREYIGKLEKRTEIEICSIKDVCKALRICHDYFAECGCVASDHGVEVPYGYQVSEKDADAVFQKAKQGSELTREEVIQYMSYILNEVAALDAEKEWVFQMHVGAVRDTRQTLFERIGVDSGGDVSDHSIDILRPILPLLNRFDDRLKVVFYCLSPNHHSTLAALCRAFGQKVNLGAAWWLNDSPIGMRRQLEYIGSVDLLANFAGMVSDSRKILSYQSRSEMFRRTLCSVIGEMIDQGQVPEHLGEWLVQYLSYERPRELFGFKGT